MRLWLAVFSYVDYFIQRQCGFEVDLQHDLQRENEHGCREEGVHYTIFLSPRNAKSKACGEQRVEGTVLSAGSVEGVAA